MPATYSETSSNPNNTVSSNNIEQTNYYLQAHSFQYQQHQLPLLPNAQLQSSLAPQQQPYSMQCSHNGLPQPSQQLSRSLPATPRVSNAVSTTNSGVQETTTNSFSSLDINNIGNSQYSISDDNSSLGVGKICLGSLSGNTSTNSSLTACSSISNGAPRDGGLPGGGDIHSSSVPANSSVIYSPSYYSAHTNTLSSFPSKMSPSFNKSEKSGSSVTTSPAEHLSSQPSEATSQPSPESFSHNSICSSVHPKTDSLVEVAAQDKLLHTPCTSVPVNDTMFSIQHTSLAEKSSNCNGAEDASLYVTCLENAAASASVNDIQRIGDDGCDTIISSDQRCDNKNSANDNMLTDHAISDSRESLISKEKLHQLHVTSIDYSSLPLPCTCGSTTGAEKCNRCCSGTSDKKITRQYSEPCSNSEEGHGASSPPLTMGRREIEKSFLGADNETRRSSRIRCVKDTSMEDISEDFADRGSLPSSADGTSELDVAPPEVVSLLQEEVLVLQRQCSSLRQELHQSRLLCAELAAQVEEAQYCQPPGYVAEIVGELHAAQKIRDEALMARLKLANEERDAVLKAYTPRQASSAASHNTSTMSTHSGSATGQKAGRGSTSAPQSLGARDAADQLHGGVFSFSPNSLNTSSNAPRPLNTVSGLSATEISSNPSKCQNSSDAVSASQHPPVPSCGHVANSQPLFVASSEPPFGIRFFSSSSKSSGGTLTSTPRLQTGCQLSNRDEARSVLLPSFLAEGNSVFTPTVPCSSSIPSCNECAKRLSHNNGVSRSSKSPRTDTDNGGALSAFEIYSKLKSQDRHHSNVLIELGLERLGIQPSTREVVNDAASPNQGLHSTPQQQQQQDHMLRSISLPPGYTLKQITLPNGSSAVTNNSRQAGGSSLVWAIVPTSSCGNRSDCDAQRQGCLLQHGTNVLGGDSASRDLPPIRLDYEEDFSPSPRTGNHHQSPLPYSRGGEGACCHHTAPDGATFAMDQRRHHRQGVQSSQECEADLGTSAEQSSAEQSSPVAAATAVTTGLLHNDDPNEKIKKAALAEGNPSLRGLLTPRPSHPRSPPPDKDFDGTVSATNSCKTLAATGRFQHKDCCGKLILDACDVSDEGQTKGDGRRGGGGGNLLKMLQNSLYGASINETSKSNDDDAKDKCHHTSTPNGRDWGDRIHDENGSIPRDTEGLYCSDGEQEYCMDTFIRKQTLPSKRCEAALKRTFLPLPRNVMSSACSNAIHDPSQLCKHCTNCSKSHDCVGACYYSEGRQGRVEPRGRSTDPASIPSLNFELFCGNCKEWVRANPDVCHQLGYYCEGRRSCDVCCRADSSNNDPLSERVDGVHNGTSSSSNSTASCSYKQLQAKVFENSGLPDPLPLKMNALTEVDGCNRITLLGDIVNDGGLGLQASDTESDDEEQDFAKVAGASAGSSAASSECSSLLSWRGGKGRSRGMEECAAGTDATSTETVVQQEQPIVNAVESEGSKHGIGHCLGVQVSAESKGALGENPYSVKSCNEPTANEHAALSGNRECEENSVNVDLRMLTRDNLHHCVERCSTVAGTRSGPPAKPPRKLSARQHNLVEDDASMMERTPPSRPKSSSGEHVCFNGRSKSAPKESTPDCDRSLMIKCREVTVQAIVHSLPGSRRNSFSRRGHRVPSSSPIIPRASPPLSYVFQTVEQQNRYSTPNNSFDAQRVLNSTENSPRESMSGGPVGCEDVPARPESCYRDSFQCTSAQQPSKADRSALTTGQPRDRTAVSKPDHYSQGALDVTEFGCFGVLVSSDGVNVCDGRAAASHRHSNSTRAHNNNPASHKDSSPHLDEISVVGCENDSKKTPTSKKNSKVFAKKTSGGSMFSALATLAGRNGSSNKNKSTKSNVGDHKESAPAVATKLSRSNSMPVTPRFGNNSVVVPSARNSLDLSANSSVTAAAVPKSPLVQALNIGLARSATMRDTTTTPSSLRTIKEAMASCSLEGGFSPSTAYPTESLVTEAASASLTSNLETSGGLETSLTSSSAVPPSSLTSSSPKVARRTIVPTSPSLKSSKKRKKKFNRKNCIRILDASNTSEDLSFHRRPSSIPVASTSGHPTAASIASSSAAKAAAAYFYPHAQYYPTPYDSPTSTGIPLIPYDNLVNVPSNNYGKTSGTIDTNIIPGLATNPSSSIPSRIPTSVHGLPSKLPPNSALYSSFNRFRDMPSAALLNATNNNNNGAALPNTVTAPTGHLPNGHYNNISAHPSNVPYYVNNPNKDINNRNLHNTNTSIGNAPLPGDSQQQYSTMFPDALSMPPLKLFSDSNFQMNTSGLLTMPSSYLSLPLPPVAEAAGSRDSITASLAFPYPHLPINQHQRNLPSEQYHSATAATLVNNPEAPSHILPNNGMYTRQIPPMVGRGGSSSSSGGGGGGADRNLNPIIPPKPRHQPNGNYLPSNSNDFVTSGSRITNDNKFASSLSLSTSLYASAVPVVSNNSRLVASTTLETTPSFAPPRTRDVIISSSSSIPQRSDTALARASPESRAPPESVPTAVGSCNGNNSVPAPVSVTGEQQQQQVPTGPSKAVGLQVHVQMTASSSNTSADLRHSSVTVTQV